MFLRTVPLLHLFHLTPSFAQLNSTSRETEENKREHYTTQIKKNNDYKIQDLPINQKNNIAKGKIISSIQVDPSVLNFYPSERLPSFHNLRLYRTHLASLDFRTRIPFWVSECIEPRSQNESIFSSERPHFISDLTVPKLIRPISNDYKRSGFQRGHLAAVASHKTSQVDVKDTFILSGNIVPQTQLCNTGSWFYLEKISQHLALDYNKVYSISGPLWMSHQHFSSTSIPTDNNHTLIQKNSKDTFLSLLKQTFFKYLGHTQTSKLNQIISYPVIGQHCIAVPTHLFKIIVAIHPYSSLLPHVIFGGFVVPNSFKDNDNSDHVKHLVLFNYTRSIEYIEFFSGLDFSGIIDFILQQTFHQLLKNKQKDQRQFNQLISGLSDYVTMSSMA